VRVFLSAPYDAAWFRKIHQVGLYNAHAAQRQLAGDLDLLFRTGMPYNPGSSRDPEDRGKK
jgi:hypothetical protein